MTGHFARRAVCPGCGSPDAATLVDLPYREGPVRRFVEGYYARAEGLDRWLSEGRFRVERCTACGLVFQREVPDAALLEALYDRWLSDGGPPEHDPVLAAQLASPAQSRDGHELMAAAAVLGRPLRGLRVLDYGMGWGLWAIVASRLGARAFGYDLAESRRQHAARHGVVPVEFDAIPALGVDFVNAEQVFEHLAEPREVLRSLARALAPGGILKISVPLARGLDARLAGFDWDPRGSSAIMPIHPLEHLNAFDAASLSAFAATEGLVPMRIPRRAYLAFLRAPGATPGRPAAFLKALARPLYHRFSRTNLYVWLRRV
jgi:2-polyprenyl-3-methyl-5-hydroxy-6-metoxy-1,4-benzoquinol methylase